MAAAPAPKKAPRAAKRTTETQLFEEDLAPLPVETGPRQSSLSTRLFAELFGTLVLMLAGLGIAAGWGIFISDSTSFTPLFSALGFGFAVTALAVALGGVSGAHLNPAVTLGFWAAGRFPGRDVVLYIAAQTVGAATAVLGIFALLHSHLAVDTGLSGSPTSAELTDKIAITWGEASPHQFGLGAAIGAEVVATALLVALVLSATARTAPKGQAPFTIGLGLTMLVLLSGPITNASLNPARATSTWIFGSAHDLGQLWPWWVSGVVAGVVTGLLFRLFAPEDDAPVSQ